MQPPSTQHRHPTGTRSTRTLATPCTRTGHGSAPSSLRRVGDRAGSTDRAAGACCTSRRGHRCIPTPLIDVGRTARRRRARLRPRQHRLPAPRRQQQPGAARPRARLQRRGHLARQGASDDVAATVTPQANPDFDPTRISADVWDLADPAGPSSSITDGSADVVITIFVLSALHPDQWATAARNIHRVRQPHRCARLYRRC